MMKLLWRTAASGAKKTSPETTLTLGIGNSTGGFVSAVQEEDVFFDPRPLSASDGEDDFYSVNGELTPTRGSTPSRSCGSTPSRHPSRSPRETDAEQNNGASSTGGSGAHAKPKTKHDGVGGDDVGAGDPVVVPAANGDGGLRPMSCGSNRNRTRDELGDRRGRGRMGFGCCLPCCSKKRPAVQKEGAA